MIQHISIKNFILIQSIEVDLESKFNVFTGETGSGKSMLIDAITFGMGQRSSASVIGKYGNSARVELVLSVPNNLLLESKLEEIGIEMEDDGTLILSREIFEDGKNVTRINNRSVTLSSMRGFLDGIIDIHSQHETQEILNSKQHIHLLDKFASNDDLLLAFNSTYRKFKSFEKEFNAFKSSDISPEEVKIAQKELEALEAFGPSLDDYESSLQSIESMNNFEKFQRTYDAIKSVLNRDDDVLSKLYPLIDLFESLEDESLLNQVKDAYYNLEDVYERVLKLEAKNNFDEHEYERLQDRIYSYQKLIKKYGSIEGIERAKEHYMHTLRAASNYDDLLMDYQIQYEALLRDVMQEANALRDNRLQAAKRLKPLIESELKDLLLEHAQFVVSINEKPLSNLGVDDVIFEVSMNKGENPAPIDKVASGGEMSRLMLGIKVIFAKIMGTSTLIFDEIDTGVSGRAGFKIGAKMRSLGELVQVITISHLSSVAACAHSHYAIMKSNDETQTMTAMQRVEGDARIREMALIMSGFVDDKSIEAARSLLHEGQSL